MFAEPLVKPPSCDRRGHRKRGERHGGSRQLRSDSRRPQRRGERRLAPLAPALARHFVAQAGRQLVLLGGDRFGQTFFQAGLQVILLPQGLFQLDRAAGPSRRLRTVPRLRIRQTDRETGPGPGSTPCSGGLRPDFFQLGQHGRLRPVKQHIGPVLLVRQDPLLVGRMGPHKIHERQAMIGVAHGPAEIRAGPASRSAGDRTARIRGPRRRIARS